ncbi:MAG TPA: hypothetical protein VK009_17465 [Chloroflexota bacterium]|nr:hypothetical protein [Chloroflexota bacterium]
MATLGDSTDHEQPRPRTSRRAMMSAAAKFAIAAPLAISILPGVAAADGDDHDDGDDRRGRGRALGLFCRPGAGGTSNTSFAGGLNLVPVASVNGGANSGDFNATNPGSDGLGSGAIAVNDSKQVLVMLRGAPANTSYDVQFVRLHDNGREDLGSFTTDANGNFNGAAPNALGGTNRAGGFVLIRNGSDEYVSTWV